MGKDHQSLSEEDRRFLLEQAELDVPGWSARVLFVLLSIVLGTALFSGLALLSLGVIAWLAGFAIWAGAWRDTPVIWFGAIATVAMVFGYMTLSTLRWHLRWRPTIEQERKSVAADLENGVVKVERLDVQGIKLLQEPEHYSLIFLLKLSNGKILVLYDYDSYDSDNDFPTKAKPTLRARERLALRSFPVSHLKRWAFEGAEIALPTPIELALDPERWPDDQSWCRVKWENIERHFGPGTAR